MSPARPRGRHVDWSDRVRSLRDPNVRARTGRFVAEGVRFLAEAHDRGAEFEVLVVSDVLLRSVVGQVLVRRLRARGVPIDRVTPERFRALSTASRASGVIAVLRQTWTDVTALRPSGRPWLAVTRVRSPGNLGTLIRTLAAVDGEGLVVLDGGADPFDPSVVRATMGALLGLRVVRASRPDFGRRVRAAGATIVGASPSGSIDFRGADYGASPVILVGAEREGLGAAAAALCDSVVRIPMSANVDSLNLGVAGSLMLYESVRHRGACGVPPTR